MSRRGTRAMGVATGVVLLSMVLLVIGAPAGASHVDPVLVEGNLNCHAVTGLEEVLRLEGGQLADGSYPLHSGSGSIAIDVRSTSLGAVFDWSASGVLIEAVFVKGGPNGNLYLYKGGASADTGLHSPVNPSNGSYYGLSHITFCVPDSSTSTTTSTTTTSTTTTSTTTTTTTQPTTTSTSTTTSTTSTTTPQSTTSSTMSPLGAIGDFVWFETDANGIQDANSIPVRGVVVRLFAGGVCAGTPRAIDVTDAAGLYLFENLPAGTYSVGFPGNVASVGEAHQAGSTASFDYRYSPIRQGTNPAIDSNAICTGQIDLAPGEVDLTWDAGIYRTAVEGTTLTTASTTTTGSESSTTTSTVGPVTVSTLPFTGGFVGRLSLLALLVASMGAMVLAGASDPSARVRRVHGLWLNQRS